MAVTWLETITPSGSAQGNGPRGLNLNRAAAPWVRAEAPAEAGQGHEHLAMPSEPSHCFPIRTCPVPCCL